MLNGNKCLIPRWTRNYWFFFLTNVLLKFLYVCWNWPNWYCHTIILYLHLISIKMASSFASCCVIFQQQCIHHTGCNPFFVTLKQIVLSKRYIDVFVMECYWISVIKSFVDWLIITAEHRNSPLNSIRIKLIFQMCSLLRQRQVLWPACFESLLIVIHC